MSKQDGLILLNINQIMKTVYCHLKILDVYKSTKNCVVFHQG